MSRPELLAPAGDLECLRTALYFGADAVYVGGPLLQLRAEAAGFTLDDLKEGCRLAHEQGKKLYVTVNSFPKNQEIEPLKEYAKELYAVGVDAVIVADLGAIAAIREAAPDLEVHVSTQANCQNYLAAKTYYDMGAKRVVLGREVTLDEIAELRKLVPEDLEIEAFVHGAMCMSYSGRCLISSFLNNRSANRGDCTQPCRWQYALVEKTRPDVEFPISEADGFSTILSSHDLCCISFLDKLEEAGVCSFKIEGRMKAPYYVATVVNAYRHMMDGTATLEQIEAELECASHRPYSSGFYFGEMKKNHFNDCTYEQDCVFMATVLDWKDGRVTVEQRNHFKAGQILEVLSPNSLGEKVTAEDLRDEEGNELDAARHPQQIVTFACPLPLQAGDMLRARK
ncbi:MAG: U32 family peptidase [Clostridiales bacterium]|nr:U32 family peptidase [Clostridiales bacterium]